MNIIITGASKGIGLELCQLALSQGNSVCAAARTATQSQGLLKLSQEFGTKLILVDLDVTSEKAPEQLLAAVQAWPQVDLLLNNAGVLDQSDDPKALMQSFQINSVAPFVITKALLGKLKKSTKPMVTQITSLMGSIADNSSGGYAGYRASKTALNMFNKCLSLDNPWLTAIVVHPGWVQTDMGGPSAPVKAVDSAKGIWQVIANAQKNSSSGQFFDYKGKSLPW